MNVERAAVAVLSALVGMGLLYLALPRTVAAILMMPGDPVLTRIQKQEPVNTGDLETLIASRERVLSWVSSGRIRTDLGLAQLLLARRTEDATRFDRERALEAIGSLREGLALAPASPHGWARLAYAELVTGGPSPAVARALAMSLRTAPFEPRLTRVRVELSLLAWPFLTTPTRGLVGDEIRLAWRQSRSELLEIARQSRRDDVVRAALSEDPAALSEFERLLGKGRD